MAARRRRTGIPPPSLKRRGATRLPRGTIVVFCEGKITEARYLKEFVSDCRNQLVTVEVVGGVGVPMTIVERAITEFRALKRAARRGPPTALTAYFSMGSFRFR